MNTTSYIKDYIANCGQNEADWDIDNLADAVDAYMDAHGIEDPNNIPEDDWSEMLQLFDTSED